MSQKLTSEQTVLIPQYLTNWIELVLSPKPTDRIKVTKAVRDLYELMGKPNPEVFFYEGLSEIIEEANARANKENMCELIGKIRDFFIDELANEIVEVIEAKLHNNAYYIISDEFEKYYEQTIQKLESYQYGLRYLIDRKEEQVFYYVDFFHPVDYIFDSSIFNFCFSVLDLNYPSLQSKWEVFSSLMASCGLILFDEDVCFVCDRPCLLSFDEQQQLHAEGKPALAFADGVGIYYYHGVQLPEQYGKLPPQQWRSQWLLSEENAELKRVLIQGIGYTRICEELNAVSLDVWKEYELLHAIGFSIDGEPIRLLKMICPSTDSIYVVRVPPRMKSAREAIRWINHGIDPEDFAVQT